MRAVVIRDSNGTLKAFGPDDGMYDPGIPLGCRKVIEPEYSAVLAEWLALPKPAPAKTLEERVAALESKTGA